MEEIIETKMPAKRAGEPYGEPLLIKHEPLRDITGAKYSEKVGTEKFDVEKQPDG